MTIPSVRRTETETEQRRLFLNFTMSRGKKGLSYISVPSLSSSSSLQSLRIPPKKLTSNRTLTLFRFYKSPRLWFLVLFLVSLFGMLRLGYNLDPIVPSFVSYPSKLQALISLPDQFSAPPRNNRGFRQSQALSSHRFLNSKLEITSKGKKKNHAHGNGHRDEESNGSGQSMALASGGIVKSNVTKPLALVPQETSRLEMRSSSSETKEEEFWKQPDGMGYRGCLKFSKEYRRETEAILSDRRKYVVVVVSGGMNQQRNQIVDAVVIARILGAALVVPVLQVNLIWGDESEFSDIFNSENFKRVLADDVRVVSSLPSKHLRTRPVVDNLNPLHVSADWIRARYHKRLEKVGLLLLRSLDSKLSKDLPSDLQKLRCKVAFHALKFAPSILELGNRLAQRMRSRGPYLALHLRMEKDVWVRTGCLPGLSPEYDEMINMERERHPELLTDRSTMTYHQRKLAGLCPLNALEVTRLVKALGAPKNARIYWAGGQPLGGKEALLPLMTEFPNFYNKEDLALPGELEPFKNRASSMAAIDYIICEKSDVFMPSHGGNMGHALQGQRAYAGHDKYITPNKRQITPYFLNSSLPEAQFNRIMKVLHKDSFGQPDLKTGKLGRDVTKFPIPECMCRKDSTRASSFL